MSGLDTLVRLHQGIVDEKRSVLTRLEEAREELDGAQRRLEHSLIEEQARVEASSEAGYTFPLFTAGVLAKREAIEGAKLELAERMNDAKAELVAAFQEFKKYDITQTRRLARARALEKKREQARLDEIAINQFMRRAET